MKILVIDDDPAMTDLLRLILSPIQAAIFTSNSGPEGVEIAASENPDIIILDLMMPEMDGFQLMEAFQTHAEWRKIPVIVLTAKDLTEHDMRRLQKPQVQKIFRKGSYSKDELVEAVRSFALRVIQAREA